MTRARVIAPLAGVVLMAGCSMPAPSVAAKVGTDVITEKTVTQIAEGCSKLLQAEPNALRLDIVRMLMQGSIARQVAAAEKIDVSATAKDTLLAQAPQMAALKDDPQCANIAEAFATVQVTVASLGGEAPLIAKGGELSVELNPRYGVWSPKTLAMAGTGSISQAAAPKK